MLDIGEIATVRRTIIEDGSGRPDQIASMDLAASGYDVAQHVHAEGQLLLVSRGQVTFDADGSRWFVPPNCALWIPAGVVHGMAGVGDVEVHGLLIGGSQPEFPTDRCRTFGVSPLLRALIVAMSNLPGRIDAHGPHGRLVRTMLDQLMIAPPGPRQMVMPADEKLRRIADHWLADPADRTTITGWARRVGMSERSLHRALLKETGMSFGRWRRHFHILIALQRLSQGSSVQNVAYDLGYDSSSTFVAMFRKAVGKSPLRFLEDHGGAGPSLFGGDTLM
jgi:AraC-like DNA-binding protein/mannose-6-phosphate isomerase-like protein (cupin superfamily)